MKKNRDVEFLFEIGCIRFISRFWRRFLNADFQNLAEHHFRVSWIALIIAKREKIKDYEKLLKMALVHDIAESRTGDTDYLSRQYVQQFKELAIKDIVSNTSLEKELLTLIQEYEKRSSIEAKIVKDADTLDVDLELVEQEARGNILRKEWTEQRKFLAESKLLTKSAKDLWDELQITNPHAWHTTARNRFSQAGDLTVPNVTSNMMKAFAIPTKALQKSGLLAKDREPEVAYKKITAKDLNIFKEVARKYGVYKERFGPNGVEGDSSVQQIIMYGYFQQDNKLLLYKRVQGTEKRLLNKSSIGIGGHINLAEHDFTSSLYNELDEEVQIMKNNKVINFRDEEGNLNLAKMRQYIDITPTAFIKDSINVGKDHLGIICKISPQEKMIFLKLRSKELSENSEYVTKKEYSRKTDSGIIEPEIWTQIVIKNEL